MNHAVFTAKYLHALTVSSQTTIKLEGILWWGGVQLAVVVLDFTFGAVFPKRGKRTQLNTVKAYKGFRFVQKSMTLNDLEWPWTVKTHNQSPLTKKWFVRGATVGLCKFYLPTCCTYVRFLLVFLSFLDHHATSIWLIKRSKRFLNFMFSARCNCIWKFSQCHIVPSVCLSVRRVYCDKMAELMITQFSKKHSPYVLTFRIVSFATIKFKLKISETLLLVQCFRLYFK